MINGNLEQFERLCPGTTAILEKSGPNPWEWAKTSQGEPNLQNKEGLSLHSPKGAAKEARKWYEGIAPFDKQVLFVHGIGLGYIYEELKSWLQLNPRRFLVILEDDPAILARFLETERADKILHDHQVIFKFFPAPELVGWGAFRQQFEWLCNAFCSVAWDISTLPFYLEHRNEPSRLIENQLRMNLRFRSYFYSERVERFNLIFRNFFCNLPLIVESFKVPHLYGKFEGVPCVLCGAGPSLSKQFETIRSLENKALILGSATGFNILNRAGIYPHFGLGIDPYDIQESRQLTHFGYETPFFYQFRFFHKAAALIHGPKIYIGSMSYERLAVWFNKELQLPHFENVELGVTTTNVFSYLAVEMGCNPLILAGMDLSYHHKTRYAEGLARHGTDPEKHAKHDVEVSQDTLKAVDMEGNEIETQWIWLEEAAQFSELANSNPKKEILNATKGGLKILGIPYANLEELAENKLIRSYDLLNWVHAEIQQSNTPQVTFEQVEKALNKWESHVREGLEKLQNMKHLPPNKREKGIGQFTKEEIYRHFLYLFDQVYMDLNAPDLEKLRLFRDQFPEDVVENALKQSFESRLETLAIFLRQSLNYIDEGKQTLKKMMSAPRNQEESLTPPLLNWEELPHDETFTLTYPDGQVKGEMHYLKGELHGIATFYSKEGKTLAKSRFIHGKRVGETLQYDIEGHLTALLHFNEEGQRSGRHQYFYPDGKLKTEISYKNGVIDGEAVLYYPSGQLKRKLHFTKGKLEGIEQMWNEQGVLITEAEYKNNLPTGRTRTWHDNGQLAKEMVFYTSSLDYDISLWDEHGTLVHKTTTLPPEPLAAIKDKSQALLASIKKMEEQLKDLRPQDKPEENNL